MSLAALLSAVRDTLQEELEYSPEQCSVQPDGRPLPLSPMTFIGIYGTMWRPDNADEVQQTLYEMFSVTVAVTRRIKGTPKVSHPSEIWLDHLASVEAEIRRINAVLIPKRYTSVLTKANASDYIGNGSFIEPLRWQGSDAEPRMVGPDWFTDQGNDPTSGIVMETQYGDAKRQQSLTGME